jgi:predicted MFS family arabinose efflux permease
MPDRRLLVLAAGAFVVAADGALSVGLLRPIAASLSVSPATAGQAVTAFGVAYALGAPALVRLARRIGARPLSVGALVVFAGGNWATAAAPSLPWLLGARVLAAASAGVFMATAAARAAGFAPAGGGGRALAVVVGGASAATALGVPAGTYLGSVIGWRATFEVVAGLSVLAAAALYRLPAGVAPAPTMPARRAEATRVLLTTVVWATGSFSFFTYVAVVLHRTTGAGARGVAAFLLLFGVTGTVGAVASGRMVDARGPERPLRAALAFVAVALAGLALVAATLAGHPAEVASAVAVALYGAATWAVTPAQQRRLLGLGGDERILLALNASALYVGVAAGGALGGLVLGATSSAAAVCGVAGAVELAALALVAPPVGRPIRPTRPAA